MAMIAFVRIAIKSNRKKNTTLLKLNNIMTVEKKYQLIIQQSIVTVLKKN